MSTPFQQQAKHMAQTAHYAECRRQKLLSDRLLKWSFLTVAGVNCLIFLIGFMMLFLTLGILGSAYFYTFWYSPFQVAFIIGLAYKKQLWCLPFLVLFACIAETWHGQMPLALAAAHLNLIVSLGAAIASFLGIRMDRQLAAREGYPQFLDTLPAKKEHLPSTTQLIQDLNRRDRPETVKETPGVMQELCIPEHLSASDHSQEEPK